MDTYGWVTFYLFGNSNVARRKKVGQLEINVVFKVAI